VRTLALETTGKTGSIALFDAGGLVLERPLPTDRRNAQTLAPGIRDLLHAAGWKTSDLQLIAVAVGPGSFTGLRVGVTTAKVLAYAVGAEVLGVNTLAAIAERIVAAEIIPADATVLWTALDAYRQQVFAARFDLPAGQSLPVAETQLLDNEAWLAEIGTSKSPSIVAGPALAKLSDRLPNNAWAVPRDLWEPSALFVGGVALRDYAAGRRDDVWTLLPRYYRPSAAEEKEE